MCQAAVLCVPGPKSVRGGYSGSANARLRTTREQRLAVELSDYLKVVRRRWRLIVTVAEPLALPPTVMVIVLPPALMTMVIV